MHKMNYQQNKHIFYANEAVLKGIMGSLVEALVTISFNSFIEDTIRSTSGYPARFKEDKKEINADDLKICS